jgi:hypothetical protein
VQKEIVWVRVELGAQHAGRDCNAGGRKERVLAGQFLQELLLVHAVLESFAAIDEDDRNFVIELAAKVGVRIDVDVVPGESAAPRKLGQALFDHFTQVASFAGINHDVAGLWHARRF